MISLRLATLLATSVALSACGRLGFGDEPRAVAYEPLPAQPTAQVQSEALKPLPGAPVYGQPGQPPMAQAGQMPQGQAPMGQPPQPGQVAMAPPPAAPPVSADKARPLALSDLAGDWGLSSGADNCRVTMSLTSWAGGRRAMSRGCSSPELQKISAWAIDGKQVILKGSDGSMVASLYSGAPEQFAGSTVSRQPISLSR